MAYTSSIISLNERMMFVQYIFHKVEWTEIRKQVRHCVFLLKENELFYFHQVAPICIKQIAEIEVNRHVTTTWCSSVCQKLSKSVQLFWGCGQSNIVALLYGAPCIVMYFLLYIMFMILSLWYCKQPFDPFITARRRYASAVLGVVNLSVHPSVCLLHACFVTNRKNLPAIFLYQMKGQS